NLPSDKGGVSLHRLYFFLMAIGLWLLVVGDWSMAYGNWQDDSRLETDTGETVGFRYVSLFGGVPWHLQGCVL
ncbi:MAG: hypothetical protein OXI24_00100, partial [Candidatus Poribacteria bacterium]|nr:hypothetical protein [Candidatus Poribacteria bacterium]